MRTPTSSCFSPLLYTCHPPLRKALSAFGTVLGRCRVEQGPKSVCVTNSPAYEQEVEPWNGVETRPSTHPPTCNTPTPLRSTALFLLFTFSLPQKIESPLNNTLHTSAFMSCDVWSDFGWGPWGWGRWGLSTIKNSRYLLIIRQHAHGGHLTSYNTVLNMYCHPTGTGITLEKHRELST